MKLIFATFSRRRLMSLTLLAGLTLVPGLVSGQQSTATFTGNITTPPNVNATNFYNSGTWNITTAAPFETANTLNYTNVGSMTGSVGWEFDWGPTISGQRSMSASFFNDSRGTIDAEDSYILNPYIPHYDFLVSYLLVSATNVINKGALIAGAAGEMVLTGTNVSLARSTLEITPITPSGSANDFALTNFIPDTAIYDEEWQQTSTFPDGTTPYAFDSSSIWDGTYALSPVFYFDGLCLELNAASELGFAASLADSTNIESSLYLTNIVYTNQNLTPVVATNYTKIFRQAVFVGVSDPNIIPADRFYPDSQNISNLFQAITVRLSSPGGTVYVEDTLGSLTNRGLLPNINVNIGNNPESPCADPTFRPANYVVSRLDPGTFGAGSTGIGPPPTNFLYDPTDFSNVVVQADYSAYHAFVDDLVRDPVNADLTNLPGRIVINAGNLDLTKATITSAGAQITIQANNFNGSTGAVVSCQNLSFNLGMTNTPGLVNVTNLVGTSPIPAMHGDLYAWSAVWTNGLYTVFTNYSQITNSSGPPTLTNNVFTNVTELDFHVLLVDATALSSTVPVTVQDLILQTNTMISDSMNVVDRFLFNGQSLTLLGTLNLSGPNLQDWGSVLAPNLLCFTNNGTLTIPEDASFGSDGPTNYAAFVNNGKISVGGSETINSDFYQCSGRENAPGGYSVTTSIGKIEDGSITTVGTSNPGGDMDFTANSLKLDNSTLTSGGAFNFYVPNSANTSLYDSGGSANNKLTCGNGFNLPVKPTTGNLLGTAITASAPNNEVDFLWAGQDRGATPAGYSNNVAIGQLILSPQSGNNNLFYFSGASANNALYVDLLDLSLITNLAETVATDPNLVIYYAAAKLPSSITVVNSNGVPVQEVETNNPLNGQTYYVVANGGSGQVPQEAEEVLNGQLGGQLRWVSSFAGPNSSVDVISNGVTIVVNYALRYSLIIDSNGDGIPNGLDPNPFNTIAPLIVTGALVQTNLPPANRFAITWLAQTNLPYQVQYTTSLLSTNWQALLNYTNTGATNVTVTVWDTNAVSSQRFYRVSHP